ncbi:MAG: dihydroxyacetone kinase subunit DhaL [Candidatus Humimicrobiaceae bacterium]
MTLNKETLIGIIESIAKKLIDSEKILTELDSHIGDADCGAGIRRGFEAVLSGLGELRDYDPPDILKKVGFTLASTIGGTSGAMLGTGFIETGKSLSNSTDISIGAVASALEDALTIIKRRGGNTEVGDKTLVDALQPAIESIKASAEGGEQNIESVLEKACAAAREGSDRTVDMVARKGRASYLGDRSKGHRDPGSVYITLMFEASLERIKNSQ